MPDAFFAILSHTPGSSSWAASQVSHASVEANAMTGRSSFTCLLPELVGQHVHEEAVAMRAVREPLVAAHHADGLEADGLVRPDRTLVVDRRLDREAVMPARRVVADRGAQR